MEQQQQQPQQQFEAQRRQPQRQRVARQERGGFRRLPAAHPDTIIMADTDTDTDTGRKQSAERAVTVS